MPKLRVRYDPNAYDFFSPDEIDQLAEAAASAQDRAICRTAAFTGLRMGELIALRWGDVDFDGVALHVYNSYSLGTLTAPKSGLTRTVPLAEQVQELLKAHRNTVPHGRADLVFPGERAEDLDGAALRPRYKKALQQAKLRKLRFYEPPPHVRIDRDRPGHHRPGPGVDGARRRADHDEVHASPQPCRRRPSALSRFRSQQEADSGSPDDQDRSTLRRSVIVT